MEQIEAKWASARAANCSSSPAVRLSSVFDLLRRPSKRIVCESSHER